MHPEPAYWNLISANAWLFRVHSCDSIAHALFYRHQPLTKSRESIGGTINVQGKIISCCLHECGDGNLFALQVEMIEKFISVLKNSSNAISAHNFNSTFAPDFTPW